MLNHPVSGLTNASKWKQEDLKDEVEHERRVALCSSPLREAIWSALLLSMRTERRRPGSRYAADGSLARGGR